MKTLVRYASLAAALGALLLTSGCFTTKSARAVPTRVDYQITVMESSQGLQLTAEQAAEIRASAVDYLKENGLTRGGEYIVKVNLASDQPGATDEWVVLKISSLPSRTYTLLAAYPGPDDFSPYDFYGYNSGFPSFARYGYYDPFDYGYGYGGGFFPPVVAPNQHHQPGDRDNRPPATHTRWDGNKPDPDHPRTNEHKPGDKDNRPPAGNTRWDGKKPDPDHPRTKDNKPDANQPRTHDRRPDADNPRTRDRQPNPDNNRRWERPRPSDDSGNSSWSGRGNGGGSYNPPPAPVRSEPSYSPPSSPAPSSAPSSPPAQSRGDEHYQQN